jgi:hypothetical protein
MKEGGRDVFQTMTPSNYINAVQAHGLANVSNLAGSVEKLTCSADVTSVFLSGRSALSNGASVDGRWMLSRGGQQLPLIGFVCAVADLC